MTVCQKMMCGCETCIIGDDMQQCLNLFHKRSIIYHMRVGHAKNLAESQLEEYISLICTDHLAMT